MLPQFAQRGVVFILGDTETSGRSPGQSALAYPDRAGVGLCLPALALLCAVRTESRVFAL